MIFRIYPFHWYAAIKYHWKHLQQNTLLFWYTPGGQQINHQHWLLGGIDIHISQHFPQNCSRSTNSPLLNLRLLKYPLKQHVKHSGETVWNSLGQMKSFPIIPIEVWQGDTRAPPGRNKRLRLGWSLATSSKTLSMQAPMAFQGLGWPARSHDFGGFQRWHLVALSTSGRQRFGDSQKYQPSLRYKNYWNTETSMKPRIILGSSPSFEQTISLLDTDFWCYLLLVSHVFGNDGWALGLRWLSVNAFAPATPGHERRKLGGQKPFRSL